MSGKRVVTPRGAASSISRPLLTYHNRSDICIFFYAPPIVSVDSHSDPWAEIADLEAEMIICHALVFIWGKELNKKGKNVKNALQNLGSFWNDPLVVSTILK